MAKTKGGKRRVVLLDAHAIIHRAFHALPEDFASSKGEPTGALYGLSAMLIRIIQDLAPHAIVACADLPEPTHRHDVYDGYKATRKKTHEGLVAQLARASDVFRAFHIPTFAVPGFEADDLLGTLVEQLKKDSSLEIIIASGDMDTLQLVEGEQVKVFTLRKGMNDTVMYDEQAVRDRFGFPPTLIPDYKALRGDPSDNIKGVKGIGEKAATELVTTFGGVKKIYAALHKSQQPFLDVGIKARVLTLLKEGEDDALFSLMLATIRTDAPVAYEVPEQPWRETASLEDMLALFDELEFRSLGTRARALFGAEVRSEPRAQEEVAHHDPLLVQEAAIAVWLLSSDITNPSLEDVLRFTKETRIETAHAQLMKRLKDTGRLFEVFTSIEKPLIPVIERMNETGIALDTEYLSRLSREYHEELSRITKEVYALAGREFNINSPAQLSDVLFGGLKLAIPRHKKTGTGKPSTRESELEKLKGEHPIIERVLAYRELQKLLSTYVDNLPSMVKEDGRLHTRFLQTGTTTGRMASEEPNIQNIPIRSDYGKRIRNAFVAAPEYTLVAIDYSQIELRIAAGLSGDEKLVKIFKDGGDVHQAVAAEVFDVPPEMVDREMRRRAKIINFGILYGMGVNALRQNLGEGVSREEASAFLTKYFADFAGLANYLERTKRNAERLGYTETLFGRRRSFSGFSSSLPHIRAQAERMALNAPIQGTQADIIKKAMIAIDAFLEREQLRNEVKLLLQVHDELVFEIRAGKEGELSLVLRELMEKMVDPALLSGVPIIAEVAVGPTWGTLEKKKR